MNDLIKDLDDNDISAIIDRWQEINRVKKEMEEMEDVLRKKMENYLKEHKWERYKDKKTKITISILKGQKKTVDMEKIKKYLNDYQLNQITKTTDYEKLTIITPEYLERMKKHVK